MATSNTPLSHPLPGFAFKVVLEVPGIEGNAEVYFKSVGGLKYETETVPVVAGGSKERGLFKRLPLASRSLFAAVNLHSTGRK